MMLKSSREQALQQIMKFSQSDRPILIIVASMILLICFAVWSYLRLLETQSWSLHTYRVLTEISEVETLTRQDRGLNLCVAIGDARYGQGRRSRLARESVVPIEGPGCPAGLDNSPSTS